MNRRTLLACPALTLLPVVSTEESFQLTLRGVMHQTDACWVAVYGSTDPEMSYWQPVSFSEALILEPQIGRAKLKVRIER